MSKDIALDLKKYPYHIFLLAAALLLIASLFIPKQTLDIHIRDTKFVISHLQVTLPIAILLFLFWFIYRLATAILWTKLLTWAHVISTLLAATLLLTSLWWPNNPSPTNDHVESFESFRAINIGVTIFAVPMIILFLFGQIAFLTNIIGGLIRRLRNKT